MKWKLKMEGAVYSSPVIDENDIIYIGGWDNFYAVYPDGSIKWKFEFKYGWVESAAAIDEDGNIYFGTSFGDQNSIYALYPNGTLNWKYFIGHHVTSSPVLGSDGSIYFGSYNKNIYAFYPNGTLRWKFKTGGGVDSSPAISGNYVNLILICQWLCVLERFRYLLRWKQ